jgi:DNA-binding transcriptional LysR family regulator
LRVLADPLAGRRVLAPRLGALLDRHPALEIELTAREHLGDLSGEGFDVALRFGAPRDSALVARKLLETRIITVASPAHVERHGRPQHPRMLERGKHPAIRLRDSSTGKTVRWIFERRGEVIRVDVPGRLTVGDSETMVAACLAGHGMAQAPELGVRGLLAGGRLIDLFPSWSEASVPLYAYYPSRVLVPAKLKAFLDFVAAVT